MKKLLFGTIATLLFISVACPVFATEIKISDVLGDSSNQETTTVQELNQKEQERTEAITNLLKLDIPVQTDNPSFALTFVDPSEQKSGVQLEIDKNGYKNITSPYTLPALSIGGHSLKFKFVDGDGATQVLTKEITILPRPPIINTPEIVEGKLVISGSALASSEVILALSSDSKMLTLSTQSDSDGKWSITISENLPTNVYTFTAYARKYGFASNLASAGTANINKSAITEIKKENTKREISFSFNDIDIDNLDGIISSNPDLLVLLSGGFILGLLLTVTIYTIRKNSSESKEIKKVETLMFAKKRPEGQSKTLFEKLTEKEKKEESIIVEETEIQKEDTKTEKKKTEERFIGKVDFLKDFKKFDPDNEKGEEKEVSKKNIKVSLTSKS